MTRPRQPAWLVALFHPDHADTRNVYTFPHPRNLCYCPPMANKKDITRLIKLLRAAKFKVELMGNGHWEVRNEKGEFVTTLAGTPSEHRGWQNALATLRRHGFIDPKKPHKKKKDRPEAD